MRLSPLNLTTPYWTSWRPYHFLRQMHGYIAWFYSFSGCALAVVRAGLNDTKCSAVSKIRQCSRVALTSPYTDTRTFVLWLNYDTSAHQTPDSDCPLFCWRQKGTYEDKLFFWLPPRFPVPVRRPCDGRWNIPQTPTRLESDLMRQVELGWVNKIRAFILNMVCVS